MDPEWVSALGTLIFDDRLDMRGRVGQDKVLQVQECVLKCTEWVVKGVFAPSWNPSTRL